MIQLLRGGRAEPRNGRLVRALAALPEMAKSAHFSSDSTAFRLVWLGVTHGTRTTNATCCGARGVATWASTWLYPAALSVRHHHLDSESAPVNVMLIVQATVGLNLRGSCLQNAVLRHGKCLGAPPSRPTSYNRQFRDGRAASNLERDQEQVTSTRAPNNA
jgi:hypothetical protein